MMRLLLPLLFVSLFCQIGWVSSAVKSKSMLEAKTIKDLKKILKTNKNVLVLFTKDEKSAKSTIKWMEPLAKDLKGQGAFVYVNCGENKESKKMCKKYGASTSELKHYKDGEFNKDYDRKPNAKSMLHFMKDPTGEAPWEEDSTAVDVTHVKDEQDLNRLRRKEKGPLLIMFYAPWCGYCKKLKPEYALAASALKGKSHLAGMDVDKSDAHNVKFQFNITGYPTIIYFEGGEQRFPYGGDMTKDGIITWMGNPIAKPTEPAAAEVDSWVEDSTEILHMTSDTFAPSLEAQDSVLVMFYAPWCGHCKTMKPEFVEAAKQLKHEGIEGSLGAVDCTVSEAVCKKHGVKGYPTVKYFSRGEMKFGVSGRTKDKIVEFMRDPQEPPPPPPEDQPWSEVSGELIVHLDERTFKEQLKKKKHVLVMFYAPWCGHCKKAKPEMEEAAVAFSDDRKVFFAGVDCTIDKKLCEQFGVTGYPTIRYFLYGKNDFAYSGGRLAADFTAFMRDPKEAAKPPAEEAWKDTPSAVVHLTDETFKGFVQENPSVMVMFYAPWCGHCKGMKPDYVEAAAILTTKMKSAVLAAVDCTVEKAVTQQHAIRGYPTLKYFRDGVEVVAKYAGGRSTNDFVKFMMSGGVVEDESTKASAKKTHKDWKEETDAVVFLNDETLNGFIQDNKNVLLIYYVPWCGHCSALKPEAAAAAETLKSENYPAVIAAIDCSKDVERCKQEDISGYPTIKFFSSGEMHAAYEGERKRASILDFIRQQSEPDTRRPAETDTVKWKDLQSSVYHLNEDTFDMVLKEMPHALVMFHVPHCEKCLTMRSEYMKAAARLRMRTNMNLAAIDCLDEPGVCARMEVTSYPSMRLFRNGERSAEYTGENTAEAFVSYLEDDWRLNEKTEL